MRDKVRLRKIIKNTSNFFYQRKFKSILLHDKIYPTENLWSFVKQIDSHIQNSAHQYKNRLGDTTSVAVAKWQQQNVVIKRYNFRNFLHAVKLQFRRSHAFRSFLYANFLESIKISTIKPIAVLQKKQGLLKHQAYFISKYEEGIPGCVYFSDDSIYKETWADVIPLIYSMIDQLKTHYIYHGDFHFGNLIIVNKTPLLLDFDRIKIVNRLKSFTHLHRKDLKNFQSYLTNHKLAHQAFKEYEAYQCFN